MDENQNSGNSNWTPPNTPNFTNAGEELPGANASLILGIIGLAVTLCMSCSPVGIVLSILALNKGRRAEKLNNEYPGMYSVKSLDQAKAGKIMGIIGTILSSLYLFILLIYVAIVGIAGVMAVLQQNT